jgi:hypothetical protein
MSDKWGRIWKEAVIAYSRYYTCLLLERRRKTTKTSAGRAGVPA